MRRPPTEVHADRVCRATYRVLVAGSLGFDWSARSQGMTITVLRAPGTAVATELCGSLADQSALMGVLENLDSHGAKLLRVECLDSGRLGTEEQAQEETLESTIRKEEVRQ